MQRAIIPVLLVALACSQNLLPDFPSPPSLGLPGLPPFPSSGSGFDKDIIPGIHSKQPANIPQPPASNPHGLSPKLTLSLEYAAREHVKLDNSQGYIVWNNVILSVLAPSDYSIKTISIPVTAVAGENVLQFVGAGLSNGFGLAIDNVKLVREGCGKNIVVNGDFEKPDTIHGWRYFKDIDGWSGTPLEIGEGRIYNCKWTSQVVELDSSKNYVLSQYFNFDDQFELLPNPIRGIFPEPTLDYTLELDWAPRTAGFSNAESSRANIIFNGIIVASLPGPCVGTGVNHLTQLVKLKKGDNVLQIDGAAVSDAYGISITNVRLTSCENQANLVRNGDFSTPEVSRGRYNYINGGFDGWSVFKAEVGDCKLYNGKWSDGLQCIELDSDANQRYTQVIHIGSDDECSCNKCSK